ncbi:Lovastatin diketide synthase LovF [Daldinia childiae]|uniref:Lovastatin diketide synthase LovF n=1 Tax=Daldinia childiae TaxID=326645 RepID=UPI001447FC99|nr:Lovastatin diketide synthase LovF [Daldinia childiae]KAF3067200.1 Lovastatin diketide synthase LovF [Daldinia childiae]
MAPYLNPSGSTSPESDSSHASYHGPTENGVPIAICGMALRLPGGISTPNEFWDFLVKKQDARGLIPESRYNSSSFYSKSRKPGHINTQYGYFLDESVDIGALDTSFFSMPKIEVERADPQQRLLLELTRECLESAGEVDYRGKTVGTFVGSFGEDWLELFVKDPQLYGTYKITGYGDFVLSNRISYEYDFKGPSMVIRTGCSSAMIGLHEACMSIRYGECNSAIVAGTNLIMAPGLTVCMFEQGVLSPNGSSRTFDADADGYARGEAINMVYIKRLDHAIRDGNPIRAVIRGTSNNADGKTLGLSVPSSQCHEAMIRRAYHVAGISDIAKTPYVECHGTGTAAGDPIEVAAVANVFGDTGVYIGSVKPNVGHSEGASGITSLIKAILALENQTIPPNIKFSKPNPKIPFEEKKLRVPVEPTPWPEDRYERASVNSFGIGGANAHVVIESARMYFGNTQTLNQRLSPIKSQLLLFSANTSDSLRRQVVQNQKYIEEFPEAANDMAYTLGVRRTHLPHRAFSIVDKGTITSTAPLSKAPQSPPDLIMVFTGQSAQWPQMGLELLQSNLTFKKSVYYMENILKNLPDPPTWSLVDELTKPAETSKLDKAYLSQPLCTAVQIALVDALSEFDIKPFGVVGHSSGEIAAAYAAKKITAEEAIIAAYDRGVVSDKVKRPGAMAAIGLGREETTQFLVPGVIIACENSPSSVTISGDKESVNDVLEAIHSEKPETFARALKVEKAYHSHHMREVGETYNSLVSHHVGSKSKHAVSKNIAYKPIFFSTVTGKRLLDTDVTNSRYWQLNLESPVLFNTGVSNLVSYHNANSKASLVFLEIGPHSALGGPLRQILAKSSASYPYVSCLVRGKNGSETFLSAVGQLWIQNLHINLNRLTNPDGTARVVPDLPTYPWQHSDSFMLENRIAKEWRFRKFPKHELLGIRVTESTDGEPVFRNVLSLAHIPWIQDHNIKGDVIFPCAGYVGMVGEAARQLCEGLYTGFALRQVVIDAAMVLTESKSTEIITSVRRAPLTDTLDSAWWDFIVRSYNGTSWTKHCSGQFSALANPPLNDRAEDASKLPRLVEPAKWYQALRNVGANYGKDFQGLSDLSCSTTQHLSKGRAIHTVDADDNIYCVHPTKVDFFLQLFSVAATNGLTHKLDKMNVPTFIEYMETYKCDSEIDIAIRAIQTRRGILCGGGEGFDVEGKMALKMKGVKLSPIEGDAATENPDPHAGARVFWRPDIDFVDATSLIIPHKEQERYMSICEELHRVCVREALLRLRGLRTDIPHLHKFKSWLEKQPKPKSESSFEVLANILSPTTMNPLVVAFTKILDSIVPMFKGEVDPVAVLMEDNALTNIYTYLDLCNRKELFQTLGHAKPNLRILEVGAGTGGLTNTILKNLVNSENGSLMYSEYTYTDISPAFFSAAKTRFEEYPNMSFQALDITKDPLAQGFEGGSYDLIVAANILHATPSLQESLSNVRKLLHTEGRLYMEELCSDSKAINFIMGIFPGWWLGADDNRVDEPYVPPERWDEYLRQAGFAGLEHVALDCPRPTQFDAIMTAKPAVEIQRLRTTTVIYGDDTLSIAIQLKEKLESESYTVGLHHWAEPGLPTDKDMVAVVDLNKPVFEDIGRDGFAAFRKFVSEVSESGAGLLWLTRASQVRAQDPRWAQIIGAMRTIRGELSADLATCEMDQVNTANLSAALKIFQKFHNRKQDENLHPEYEYAIVDGVVHIPRIYPITVNDELREPQLDEASDVGYDLRIGKYGRLNTLAWTAIPVKPLVGDEILVETKAFGMNFKDVLVAMGIVENRLMTTLGIEACGVISKVGPDVKDLRPGDRVFLFGEGCFSTQLVLPQKVCAKIPDSLSFDDAATMPCVFATVIYGLLDVGQLQEKQTLLIHSACGGVGLAAIQVAKMIGADIYCTVGNEEKVQYLMSTFMIPRSRIFNSRDKSFLGDIMAATNGRGVDVVLNSLSGELLHTSWECVAEFGKMIEIGKRDLIGNGKLALNIFELNRSYHGIDLGHIMDVRGDLGNSLLKTIAKYYEQGHIQPIRPVKIFTADAIGDCFRYMQKGQHIGKITITLDCPEAKALTKRQPTRNIEFQNDASYLLVGGLGGLGRAVSNWMVEHGARHLIFLSRRAGETAEDQAFFKELKSQGCKATAVKGSVASLSDVERAVTVGGITLKGILNVSMVLRDQSFINMTYEDWTQCADPKVLGTWNLHNATVGRGLNLDLFVLFGSISGIVGQRGQANYSGANTFLDSFVQYRHSLGLNASAVDIGVMLDHGYVADNPVVRERLLSQGIFGIRIAEMLDAITAVIVAPRPAIQDAKSGRSKPFVSRSELLIGMRSTTSLTDVSNRVPWKGDRRVGVYLNSSSGSLSSSSAVTSSELLSFVSSAIGNPAVLSTPDAVIFVAIQISKQLLSLLMKPVESDTEIDINRTLQEMEFDSLVAVEMRSWWKSTFGFDISVLEMLGAGSMKALGEKAVEGLKERFGASGNEDDGAVKYTHEEVILTKMP